MKRPSRPTNTLQHTTKGQDSALKLAFFIVANLAFTMRNPKVLFGLSLPIAERLERVLDRVLSQNTTR
jgi:hypothetical protein